MISGFNVRMVAVVFMAVFVSVVGVVWPSRRAATDSARDVRMNGNDLRGLFRLMMWMAVAVMVVAEAILSVMDMVGSRVAIPWYASIVADIAYRMTARVMVWRMRYTDGWEEP